MTYHMGANRHPIQDMRALASYLPLSQADICQDQTCTGRYKYLGSGVHKPTDKPDFPCQLCKWHTAAVFSYRKCIFWDNFVGAENIDILAANILANHTARHS